MYNPHFLLINPNRDRGSENNRNNNNNRDRVSDSNRDGKVTGLVAVAGTGAGQ